MNRIEQENEGSDKKEKSFLIHCEGIVCSRESRGIENGEELEYLMTLKMKEVIDK